jgi:hypothetical protein
VLEVVFTERVVMPLRLTVNDSDASPTPPLLAALYHKDPLFRLAATGHVEWVGSVSLSLCVQSMRVFVSVGGVRDALFFLLVSVTCCLWTQSNAFVCACVRACVRGGGGRTKAELGCCCA